MPENLFAKFETADLGLQWSQETFRLAAHNKKWREQAEQEIERLIKALGPGFRIHHIGSTSIPKIAAKPILDLLLAADSLTDLDSKNEKFESLGYDVRGEYGLEGRRYYVLMHPQTKTTYVHLHAWEKSRPEIIRHLAFRDYLRQNPAAAEEYESVKLNAVTAGNREKYVDEKAPVISKLLEEAMSWSKTDEAQEFYRSLGVIP